MIRLVQILLLLMPFAQVSGVTFVYLWEDLGELRHRYVSAETEQERITAGVALVERLQWQDLNAAAEVIEEMEPLFVEAGERERLIWNIASALPKIRERPVREVIEELSRSAALAQQIGLADWRARAYFYSGWLEVYSGNFSFGTRLYLQALNQFRQLNMNEWFYFGSMQMIQGVRWQRSWEEMLEISTKLEQVANSMDPVFVAHARLEKGRALSYLKRFTEADFEILSAITHFREARDYLGLVAALGVLSDKFFEEGKYSACLATLEDAYRVHRREDLQVLFPEIMMRHARALLANGRPSEAANKMIQCLAELEQRGLAIYTETLYSYFADAADQFGYQDMALQALHKALNKTSNAPVNELYLMIHRRLAKLWAGNGDYERAYQALLEHVKHSDPPTRTATRADIEVMQRLLDDKQNELEIASLRSEARMLELVQMNDRKIRNFTIVLLGLTLVIILLMVFRSRVQVQSNRAMKLALDQALKAEMAADEANKAKSDFLATVSHEIRTPMNGLIGMTSLLQETPLNPTQRNYMRVIQQCGSNLLNLINAILDLSKIEANKLELEEVLFSPVEKLRHSIDLMRPKAEEKSINLEFEVSGNLPERVLGDPTRFGQIFINLLSNAIKFTEQGKVEMLCRGEVINENEVMVEVVLADTGIGIPEERFKDIFEAFRQVDSSITRKYGGSGLGLAICQRLCHLMGGTIDLQSSLGKGTVFTVKIPFKVPVGMVERKELDHSGSSNLAIAVPESIDYSKLRGKRVLIVEDNDVNRRVTLLMLDQLGMSTNITRNAMETRNLLRTHDFDCMLLDVGLPDEDGMSLTRWIHRTLPPERIPVIVGVSAFSARYNEATAIEAGMDAFLQKPVLREALLRSMVQKLGERERQFRGLKSNSANE